MLALQLYSLRRETGIDPEGTLRSVPGLGYRAVETAGTYGWSAARWKELLAETGLTVISAHTMFNLENLDREIEFQQAIGNKRYVVPYLADQTADGFRRTAEMMSEAARRVKAVGGEVLYHNHDFEFKDLGGGLIGYDILLRETEGVKFEVDTFWIEKSGRNAADFIKKYADRIGLLHAKELRRRDKSEQTIGQGDIDFPAIVELAKKWGWPVIVEFEGEGAPEAVRKGGEYLRSLMGA